MIYLNSNHIHRGISKNMMVSPAYITNLVEGSIFKIIGGDKELERAHHTSLLNTQKKRVA